MRNLGPPMLALILGAALCACGGDSPSVPKGPSKADVVALLRTLEAAVSAGDIDAAMATLHPMPEEKMREATRAQLPELMAREGVRPKNIDRMAERGEFGPLETLWPELGPFWAQKAGADVKQCYGLKAGRAKVGVHWGKDGLTLIYVEALDKS